ncbi:MAG TPA: hypothetical protein PK402_07125 [Tepidisphaeraceae bacterium]|nr:hypothetical protein [Tepidisphaeraceae bacterium]
MSDPIELEPATGIRPRADLRKPIPEPLPVRLVAIEDVHLPAAAGREVQLDEFYVGLLGLKRAPDRDGMLVYHAENVDLVFDVLEPPIDRAKLTPTPFEVDWIELIIQRLLELEVPYERMRGVMPGHEYVLLVDPAGNWVSLMQHQIIG